MYGQLARGPSVRFTIHELDWSAGHYGRYSVLVDKLRVPVAAKQNAEIVEPRNDPLQLDPIYEKDRQRRFLFSDVVEELILKARYSFGGHVFSVFV